MPHPRRMRVFVVWLKGLPGEQDSLRRDTEMVFDTLLSHSRLLLAAAVIAVLLVSAPPPSAAQQPSQADVAQPYKFAALDPAPENTTDSSNISPVTNETPEKQSNRILGIFPNYRAVSADTQLPPLSLQRKFWLATQDSFENPSGQTKVARASEPSPAGEAQPPLKSLGTVSGRVVDQNGSALAGIDVQIQADQESPIQEVQSGEDGRFNFDRVPPGPFQLTITGEGFVPQTISGPLGPGQDYVVPSITMSLATVVTEVRVSPPSKKSGKRNSKT